jgi:hypothetical protein
VNLNAKPPTQRSGVQEKIKTIRSEKKEMEKNPR